MATLQSPRYRQPEPYRLQYVSPTYATSRYVPRGPVLTAPRPTVTTTPRRHIAVPRRPIISPRTRPQYEDKGLLGGIMSSIGNVISFPGTVIKALPTLVGKGAQSVVGLGETLFDIGADIINPNLYTSRSEVDLAKGRKLGLKGEDLLAYSMQRTVPLLAPIVESVPKTARRLAETATLGFYDTGEPGFDYYQALRQGRLGTMALEDLGNVVMAGRMLGLGNLGVQAGARAAAAGRPRLGSALSTVGKFAEEPIATSTRGLARAGLRVPKITVGPMPRESVLQTIATSERPFRAITSLAGADLRRIAGERVQNLDALRGEALRRKTAATEEGRLADAEIADREAVRYEQKRNTWLRFTEFQKRQREQVRTGQLEEESLTNTFNQMALRYEQQGSVPEAPRQLRERATNLRAEAQVQGDPTAQARLNEQADFLDRQAQVKEANPDKLKDKENRRTNFSAAVIVVSKLIDQIMADRRAGKSLDEIMTTIQPRELLPRVATEGYEYTPAAVQRAIDFVEGRLDDVDRMDMDVASSMMASFANYLETAVTQPGVLVGGVLSPAQFADTPIPEIVVAELAGESFETSVLVVLDELTVRAVEEYFPEVAAELGPRMNKPTGVFKEFASQTPDSPQYNAARVALLYGAEIMSDPAQSILGDSPRIAQDAAEFFSDPAIYPARLRPMVAYRASRAQEAGAADVRSALQGLKDLVDSYGPLLTVQRKTSLESLLGELDNPRRVFDRDFYKKVQNYLTGVLSDIQRRRAGTQVRQGEVQGLIGEGEARLAEIEAQARAVAGMVEQALLRPEELVPGTSAESQGLRSQAEGLRAEAARLSSQTVPGAAPLRNIEADTIERNSLQETVIEQRQKLDDLETTLKEEEGILNAAANDAQNMDVFLAEIAEAETLARSGVGAEPLPAEQKAWKAEQVRARQDAVDTAESAVDSMFVGGNRATLAREDFWVEDIWVALKRAIPNPRHFREFFQRLTETKYADVPGRIPTRAEFAPPDPNVGKLVRRGVIYLDEVASDNPRGSIPKEEWTLQLAEAWTAYMEAVDDLNEMKRKPLKSDKSETVKDMMMRERSAEREQMAFINPRTGEPEYGVRSLDNLRRVEQIISDTDELAKQVQKVRKLREDRDAAARKLESTTASIRQIDARIQLATEQATAARLQGPQVEARRLTEEANRLTKEADRLDAEAVRLRPSVARERITLTTESGKRLRAATPRRGEGGEVTGYEFTKGVARKLDQAETAQLAEQQKLHEESLQLQRKYNEEDAALGEGMAVREGAQRYVGALGEPTPRAVLQGAVSRPRLLGETTQPTWVPVGESSNVRPVSAMDMTMRGEGMAPESRISIERRRTSTFMAQTPAQFAARMKDILRQVARNKVVARIIQDELLTSNVEKVIDETKRTELLSQAQKLVDDQAIPRGTRQYDTMVQKTYGDLLLEELNYLGWEAVSPVTMPEEGDIYAGRSALGSLSEITTGDNVTPTTLVMRRGMRQTLSSYFEPKGGPRVPSKLAAVFDFVGNKTAKWKSVVLPFSLRWQVGDAMGNIINAHVRAGIPLNELTSRIIEISKRLKEPEGLTNRQLMFSDVLGKNVADPVVQVLLGAGLQAYGIRLSDLKEMHPRGTLKPAPGVAYSGGFRPFFPGFREKSFAFNETQNGIVRSAVALTKLEEALAKRGRSINEIDPVTVHNDPVLYEAVREAVSQANDALGNFSDLSPFEKQFVRNVYPFWSWVKFINKAATQLLIDQPDRVLFYGHLGSMALGEDGQDLYGWLKDQTIVPVPGLGTFLIDLSFTNPYSDAILMGRNPFEESLNVATNVSPIIRAGLKTGGELAYGATGRRFPLLETVSRPGYLEGRPGETTRTWGDTLGGIAYQNFRTFAGPYRFLTDVAPTWRVPGTDVTLGPGPRYQQGSVRTTGTFSRPMLSPTEERIGAVFQGLGVPVPSARLSEAEAQGRELRRAGRRSLRRREQERRLARIGR